MSTKLNILTNILTPLGPGTYEFKTNHILSIDKGKIADIVGITENQQFDLDLRDSVAIPGLIDVHVHLSQYRVRGLYKDALLPWLNEVVFPEEQKSADYDYSYVLAEEFFQALYKAGTTTAVIYTAPYQNACETAFETARLHNFRAIIGMTLMDQNSPEALLQKTDQTQQDCLNLIKEYHSPDKGLEFIFTPRFAPTCSMQLMQWLGSFAKEHGIRIQTHLSENKDEIKWVKDLFGLSSYTEVYQKAGILTDKTILAHCIHLSDKELETLKEKQCKIAHCPDSNFYLRSGEFPLADVMKYDLPFALGSDVGAGTTLNMLYHAKMYNFRQSQTPVSASDAFYRVTLGAAQLLGIDRQTGSLETGKDADIVFLKMPESQMQVEDELLSRLVFTGHEWQIAQVYARGIRKV